MRKLTVFNFITLNGYYKGANEDISWHSHEGEEEQEFSSKSAQSGNTLLFGRTTYEMMASFWPTPMAAEAYPGVAKGMNESEKIVFSNTLEKADWENTTIMKGDVVEQIRQLKKQPGSDMAILGSGTILTQFAEAGLIDQFQFLIVPVVMGSGTSVFEAIGHNLKLKLTDSRTFKSGTVLLTYEPE